MIREVAVAEAADLVVFGSQNAGQITRTVIGEPLSVGEELAKGFDFDVLIVRSGHTEKLDELLGTTDEPPPAYS